MAAIEQRLEYKRELLAGPVVPPPRSCLPTVAPNGPLSGRGSQARERRARTKCAAWARRRSGGDDGSGFAAPLAGAVVPPPVAALRCSERPRRGRGPRAGGEGRRATRMLRKRDCVFQKLSL
jgi:hypothetical protein